MPLLAALFADVDDAAAAVGSGSIGAGAVMVEECWYGMGYFGKS